jgi:hypothetical protein
MTVFLVNEVDYKKTDATCNQHGDVGITSEQGLNTAVDKTSYKEKKNVF